MALQPAEHLEWVAENIAWFESIDCADFDRLVPRCPGWRVEDVVVHLALGLGSAYPHALATRPDAEPGEAFADVDFSRPFPKGLAAAHAFATHMKACLTAFRATDPDHPCWTYAGPGTASFWFRRAAIEIALHRNDVEEALELTIEPLTSARSLDAIAEAAAFALPLAATITGASLPAITLHHDATATAMVVGSGMSVADVHGTGDEVLNAAWGRSPERVRIVGDEATATAWFGLVPLAFAGPD